MGTTNLLTQVQNSAAHGTAGYFFEVYFGWNECPGQGVFVLSHSGCILLCQWV